MSVRKILIAMYLFCYGFALSKDLPEIRLATASGSSITTFAGTGAAGFGGDGGEAYLARLDDPQGITIGPDGSVFVADFRNCRIRRITPQGMMTTAAGIGTPGYGGDGGPAGLASLSYPTDVEADAAGNLYIADTGNHVIRKITTSGAITTVAGNGAAGFTGDGGLAVAASLYNPTAVAVDSAGNLYIADTYNSRIRRVTPAGIISTVVGNGAFGFSGDGGPATEAALNEPTGIVRDPNGNLYIADRSNHRIRRVSPSGTISTYAGVADGGDGGDGGPATAAGLYAPSDIALDTAGNLYIADQSNHRIRKVLTTGTILNWAGAGTPGYSGDGGLPERAQLRAPVSVAVDAEGTVYAVDAGNHAVRRIVGEPAGVVSATDGGPVYTSGLSQFISVTVSHSRGYQQLGIVNVLINDSLNGFEACYIAYSQPTRTLYLVKDGGPGSGLTAGIVPGGTGSVENSQCSIFASGSSATGSGTTLTLRLNISFKSRFGGNRVVYAAARSIDEVNSGWRTVGVAAVPQSVVSYPRVAAMLPAAVSGEAATVSVDFRHATNATRIQTVWMLVNSSVDGRNACYVAYYAPGNVLYLIPDNGDGSRAIGQQLLPNMVAENSQCQILGAGSRATISGNSLTLSLNVRMKQAFRGPRAVWSAVQDSIGQVTSPWTAVGAWFVP